MTSTATGSISAPGDRAAVRRVADAGLFVLLSASFWISAGAIAATRPYWMDEVLAVWTARMSTAGGVWDALMKGAEFSPPLYHLMLQKIIQLGGGGALSLRLPSIAAIYIVGLAGFILARRRYAAPLGLLAMAMCLTSCLFLFAIQARQNAPVAACFALAVVLWDIPADKRPSWWSAAGIFALLSTAVGMHFYAVLLAASVGLMELAWMAVHRRIRWLYVIAIGLACLSVFLWWPLMQQMTAFNAGDSSAPDYYARPLLVILAANYPFLLIRADAIVLSPLTVLIVAIVVRTVIRKPAAAQPRPADNLPIIIAVTCAIPLLVFAFASVVTHTFNMRYVIAATLGLSLFTVQLIAGMRWAAAGAYAATAAAAGVLIYSLVVPPQSLTTRSIALVNGARSALTIATGQGLRYLELREGAAPAAVSRLVYLKSPRGTASPDPTNEHQVERWASIDARVAVSDIAPFVAANPRFLIYSDSEAVDLLPQQLKAFGCTATEIARDGTAYLAEVSGCPAGK